MGIDINISIAIIIVTPINIAIGFAFTLLSTYVLPVPSAFLVNISTVIVIDMLIRGIHERV